jgi:tRNA threonylcarbamoyl adenosine modification protein YeaZ
VGARSQLPWSIVFVLAIDTSSPAVTAGIVALDAAGERVVASQVTHAARGHGELLAPAIAACLADAGLAAADVGAVVAGTGPGPYTGLRVGLVTTAALGHARGIPTYGVCSLDAVPARDAVVVTDARRHEVYWARYDEDGHRVAGPGVARPDAVPLDGIVNIAGAAVDRYDWPARLTRLPQRYPEPAALVARARDRLVSGAGSEPLTPRYLRRPDAVVPGAPKTVSQSR